MAQSGHVLKDSPTNCLLRSQKLLTANKGEKQIPLLSVGTDAKTTKGEKLGYLTGVMYLAPAQESGVMNTCPMASEGCKAVCLYTAGRGMFKSVRDARVARTKKFKVNPKAFMVELKDEIIALERKAKREGLVPVMPSMARLICRGRISNSAMAGISWNTFRIFSSMTTRKFQSAWRDFSAI